MYDLYLMDADDTLLDFRSMEEAAFRQAFESLGLEARREVYLRYRQINRELWGRLERGEIAKDRLLLKRFETLSREFDLHLNAHRVNEAFLDGLSRRGDTVEGAREVLAVLSRRARIAVITNGLARAQRSKLALSGLSGFISRLIISEEVGAEKPSPRFFEAAMAACGRDRKEGVLVVGDSPQADIGGARAFGLDSCLFDPHGQHPQVISTYRIRSLWELPALGMPAM